eukprot:Hpha_TRINITY_DN27723_c0_g1::TRINITY_DN27723_c0_g1_i1::g.157079::m.157079/K00954/E2.7.7.3A, coaD, kdtB; pantetheine-phosphate adenylyltransferase
MPTKAELSRSRTPVESLVALLQLLGVRPFAVLALTGAVAYILRPARYILGALSLLWLHRLIFGSRLISFPYPPVRAKEGAAVYAGSFNPPHLGHAHVLAYLAARHERVFVLVGVNPGKQYAVSAEERVELIRGAAEGMGLSNVEVETVSGFVWRTAKERRAVALYRGIRSWGQDGLAEKQLQVLNDMGPVVIGCTLPVPTRYVQGDPRYAHVSSSLLRKRIVAGETISDLVPPCIAAEVARLYGAEG